MATTTADLMDSAPVMDWLRALLRRGFGLVLLIGAGFVALAIFGFNPDDPSINQATSAVVSNPTGANGAIVADLCLQALGYASALFALAGFAWGLRLLLNRPLEWAWVPLLALPLSILALATYLANWPLPADEFWPYRVGLGGFVGDFLFIRLYSLLEPPLYGWVTGIVAVALSIVMLGLRLDEVSAAVTGVARGSAKALARLGGRGRSSADQRASRTPDRRPMRPISPPRETPMSVPVGAAGDTLDPEKTTSSWRIGRLREMIGTQTWGAGNAAQADNSDGAARSQRRRIRPSLSGFAQVDDEPAIDEGIAVHKTKSKTPREPRRTAQQEFPLDGDGDVFELPSIDHLAKVRNSGGKTITKAQLDEVSRQLETVLDDFGVRGEIIDAKPGPVVTLFELEPAPGTRASRVISLADDIARNLCALSVRVAVVPGRNVIGIELPNEKRDTVFLREIFSHEVFRDSGARLALALGKEISGLPIVVDLARMPHLLIAGTTGSGKSVAINAMILSLLYRLTPDECRMILIDPKVIELSIYDDIPHLLAPVVTEPHKAVVALKWVVRQMDERYRLMSHVGVRDIFAFNRRIMQAKARGDELKRRVRVGFEPGTGAPIMEDQPIEMKPLPLMVVVVDEVADLMMTAGKEIEAAIQRPSQKARAAGIHLIVATQRPSVDVLTGVIKANLPSRISFRVSSKIDSRTIIGEPGAEQLLGQGDMLYVMPGDRITRIHGPLVTEHEVEAVVSHLKAQGRPDYIEDVTAEEDGGEGMAGGELDLGLPGSSNDAQYDQAVQIVARDGKASTSYLQRKMSIGYNSAAKLVERMEQDGLISTADHVGRRQVLMGRGGLDGEQPTDQF